MQMRLLLLFAFASGCASGSLPATACDLRQMSPIAMTAAGTQCVTPSDDVHAQVIVGGYSVLVTIPSGFAAGQHVDALVDELGTTDAHWPTAIVNISDAGDSLSLDVIASQSPQPFAATLTFR